ncbi:MAG: ABC transporter permease [Spirochaetales bacterium]|nr:ABC transporter permease [Candidatus Physcosoma equi]
MFEKALKRFLSFLLTLLLVSVAVFAALEASGGDSSSVVLSDEATKAMVEEYRMKAGLDDPFLVRYGAFLVSFLTLDWGSTVGGKSIRTVLSSRLPVTLALAFWSMLFSFVFSLFFSLKAVEKKNGKTDHALSFLSSLFLVLPSFLSSLVLVLVFSFGLRLFPVAGYSPLKYGFLFHFRTLFLPSLTLALLHSSFMMRIYREALEENLSMPFATAQLGKGMKEKELPLRSALKPSLTVILPVLGESLASALGGAAVVENVFALPGLGSLLVQSALSRDVKTSGIVLLLVALMVSVVFLLTDCLSAFVDPRGGRER